MNEKDKIKFHRRTIFDDNGWAEFPRYLPLEYDLVEVCDNKGRSQCAWWTGAIWDSGFRKLNIEIVKWKRKNGIKN